jgi:hypothetical protein
VTVDAAPDADIVVRRCTVRVVRRGGWSWGPEPQALPRRVVEALPALLRERFAAAAAGGADVEITEPVTLDVSVSLGELLAGLAPEEVGPAGPAPLPPAEPDDAGPPSGSTVDGDTAPVALVPAHFDAEPAALARLRAALAERGVLDRLTTAQRASLAALGLDPAAPPDGPAPVATAATEGPASAPVDTAAAGASAATPVPAGAPGPGTGRGVRAGEVELRSALPFLVASALARIGALDAVGAALSRAGLLADAPLVAAALAYKALGPLRRGWLRDPRDRADAAAFAGIAGDVAEEALVGLARRVRPALPVLTSAVGLTVCAGHEAGRPLLLAGTGGGGLLLVEPDGLFPVAWAEEAAELLPYWRACDRPPVLVAAGVPAAALAPVGVPDIAALTGAGVALASDAAPSRGERWRRLPRAAAGDLKGLTERLAELVAAMDGRRAVPLAEDAAFERALTVTAGVALGTIAWLLWRHREPPDPQLTLARLGDLGGVVRYGPDAVHVRLPLGRRHTDLLENGLLADVPHVVWLGGRTLTFGGG